MLTENILSECMTFVENFFERVVLLLDQHAEHINALHAFLRDKQEMIYPIDGIPNASLTSVRNTCLGPHVSGNANFRIVRASGNGSCLYNSLSILLVGSEEMASALRLLCVRFITENRNFYENLAAHLGFEPSMESSFADGIRNTATFNNPGILYWGSGIQMHAMSYILQRRIFCFRTDVLEITTNCFYPSIALPMDIDFDDSRLPLRVALQGAHFNPIVPIKLISDLALRATWDCLGVYGPHVVDANQIVFL